ncbi:MAG: hypothetical protein DBY20_01550 [Coriobacteriia bacterium]|nr:MAG: hypothetical protein DBY20_01550 [Coriobacteriia bacterium]
MEESVRDAIASLLAEGTTPSFYKVADRAQIARSSLYRKQNLRQLVEDAREGRGIGGNSAHSYDRLVQENESLRREVRALRREVKAISGAEIVVIGEKRSSVIEYCIIDFPQAA